MNFNPFDTCRYNYNAASNDMKLVHWLLMGGLLHSVEDLGGRRSSLSLLLAVPHVTAHPSTASVPITVLLYNSLLMCSFNVGIKASNRIYFPCYRGTSFYISRNGNDTFAAFILYLVMDFNCGVKFLH